MRLTIVLLLSSFCGAQVISGVALERVPPGNYVKSLPGSTIATCNSADTNSPCTQYVTTYTDQTLSNQCLGPAPGPTSGVGCANPGKADSDGNYTIFASAGVYKVCVSSPGTPVVINCSTVGTGNGNSSSAGASSAATVTPTTTSANPFSFGTVQNGTNSNPLVVTIANTGLGPLTIYSAAFTTGTKFSSGNLTACNGLLPANTDCSLLVNYTPTTGVTDTDTLTFVTTAPINPQSPLTVSLSGSGTASASYSLTVNCAAGTGKGTITSADGLINATCNAGSISGVFSNSYASGATPVLTATSTDGGTAGNFSGGGCSSNPCTVTVSAATLVTGSFTAPIPKYVLSISGIDQGIGTVASDLNDIVTGTPISCTSTAGVLSGKCSATFNQGQTPTLTETPSGSCTGGACTFAKWGGVNGCTTTSTCLLPALSSNVTVSVDFVQPTGNGPVNRVQLGTTGTASGAIKWTFGSAQNAGDLNVCGAWWNDATTTVTGVTDTAGNTYTQVSASPKAASGQTTVMYYSCNIAASASGNVVTFALNATPTSRQAHCAEYSGIIASCADGSAGATGSGTSVSAGSVTTTAAGDLLVGTTVVAGSITSPSSGWIQDILDSASNDFEHIQVGVAGAYPFAPTQSPSSAFGAIQGAFKTGGGAPATFSVNIACGPTGTGTVTSPTGGLSTTCTNGVPSGTQSVSVNSGSTITLTATPAAGSSFSSYSGAGCSTSPSCVTQAITTNTTITANFSVSGVLQFYVATTGSDSNTGTQASPWLTIAHANAALTLGASGSCSPSGAYYTVTNCGAIVHVGSGTYTGSTITITNSGTATQRIAYVSDTQYGAHLVGTACSVIRTTANYIDIIGFDVTGSCSTGILLDGSHVRAIANYVHDLPGSGGYAGILTNCCANAALTDAQAIGNIINNIGPAGVSPYVHGIYISTAQSLAVNNIVSNTAGYCIQLGHQTTQDVVSNNTSMNCRFGGLGLEGGNGVTTDNSSILNNIFLNTGNGTDCGIEERYGATGASNVYRNNLLVANSCPFFFANGARTTTGNLCDVAETGCNPTLLTASQANPTNIFVNYTGNAKTGNYALKAGSIRIDGVSLDDHSGDWSMRSED